MFAFLTVEKRSTSRTKSFSMLCVDNPVSPPSILSLRVTCHLVLVSVPRTRACDCCVCEWKCQYIHVSGCRTCPCVYMSVLDCCKRLAGYRLLPHVLCYYSMTRTSLPTNTPLKKIKNKNQRMSRYPQHWLLSSEVGARSLLANMHVLRY